MPLSCALAWPLRSSCLLSSVCTLLVPPGQLLSLFTTSLWLRRWNYILLGSASLGTKSEDFSSSFSPSVSRWVCHKQTRQLACFVGMSFLSSVVLACRRTCSRCSVFTLEGMYQASQGRSCCNAGHSEHSVAADSSMWEAPFSFPL